MNLFQSANAGGTALVLGAFVAGLAKYFIDTKADPFAYFLQHTEVIYLGIFIVVLRIKAALDDHRHFGEEVQDKTAFRYAGFILAVVSWLFWALAAYLLPWPDRASELMAISILFSTLWVAVHVIEILVDKERRNREVLTSVMREKWILLNVAYMLSLVTYIGWLRPVVKPLEPKALLALLFLLAFDVATSRSFRGIVKPT